MTEPIEDVDSSRSEKLFLASVGVIILLIVGGIVVGKHFNKPAEAPTVTYNNYVFRQLDQTWVLDWQLNDTVYSIPLRFNPYQVENVTMVGVLDNRFRNRNIYLTFDPNETDLRYIALAAGELGFSLGRVLNFNLIAACTVNDAQGCADQPIISCNSTEMPVIYLKSSDTTLISLVGNCMTIQGNGFELMRATDKVLYLWFGIMK